MTKPMQGSNIWEAWSLTVCSTGIASSTITLTGLWQHREPRHLGTSLACTWRAWSHHHQLLALVGDKEEPKSRILHSAPSSMVRYYAAVRQTFGNSSCRRSVTIQSASTPHVSPPGFLAVSSYHLLISPWPSPGLRPRGGEQISMT